MADKLDELRFYQMSLELWDEFWNDSETLLKDVRGREICKQLTRAVGSISANIEEGYGRGFGKEYPHFLRISRGSAREARGWFRRSKYLIDEKIINERDQKFASVIAMLSASISTLEKKKKI